MRKISKEGVYALLDAGIIKNTGRGYVDPKNIDDSGMAMKIGYYRTIGVGKHRYIEDWYAIKAEKLLNQSKKENK